MAKTYNIIEDLDLYSELEEEIKNLTYNVKVNVPLLNIRTGAGYEYSIVGTVEKGQILTIVEEKSGWGKTDKGWVCLEFVK